MDRPIVSARSERQELDRKYYRNWKYSAVQFIRVYAMRHRKDLFISDDVIVASFEYGLDPPLDAKNWGPAFQEAQDMGIIASCGTVHAPNRKSGMTTLWSAC